MLRVPAELRWVVHVLRGGGITEGVMDNGG
jgi:hypothetical protein